MARQRFGRDWPAVSWDSLSRRAQHRLAYTAKRWLNRTAVEHMTATLLAESDATDELLGHLRAIAKLAGGTTSL